MAGVLSKQVNLLNIALEGLMLFGAMAAVMFGAWFGNPWVGLLAAMIFAGLLSLIFALFVIDWKANLIVAGLAVNILALGLTAYLLVVLFNARGAFSPSNLTSLPKVNVPIIDQIPILGDILSGHGVMVYLAWISVLLTSLLLYRTPLGLHIRAVGEHKEAAKTAGIPVRGVEYVALLLGGILSGMAGAQLSIGDLALFSDNMTNGRGFIALAAVFFGAGNPWLTSLGCLLFGFFEALQYRLQITTGMPPQLLQMMPYLIVVIILVVLALQKRMQKRLA
jgi:simple sugar transport system permease protein